MNNLIEWKNVHEDYFSKTKVAKIGSHAFCYYLFIYSEYTEEGGISTSSWKIKESDVGEKIVALFREDK